MSRGPVDSNGKEIYELTFIGHSPVNQYNKCLRRRQASNIRICEGGEEWKYHQKETIGAINRTRWGTWIHYFPGFYLLFSRFYMTVNNFRMPDTLEWMQGYRYFEEKFRKSNLNIPGTFLHQTGNIYDLDVLFSMKSHAFCYDYLEMG